MTERRRARDREEEEDNEEEVENESTNATNNETQTGSPQNSQQQEILSMPPLLQTLVGIYTQQHQQTQPQQHAGMYVADGDLEAVIHRLMQSDSHKPHGRPAAPYHVQELDEVVIEKRNKDKLGRCAVCNEDFEIGTEALRMPCKHVFHHDCLHPWLNVTNTCPLCRHEMPTLDVEYEDKKHNNDDDEDDVDDRHRSRNAPEFMYL